MGTPSLWDVSKQLRRLSAGKRRMDAGRGKAPRSTIFRLRRDKRNSYHKDDEIKWLSLSTIDFFEKENDMLSSLNNLKQCVSVGLPGSILKQNSPLLKSEGRNS